MLKNDNSHKYTATKSRVWIFIYIIYSHYLVTLSLILYVKICNRF
eukprot:UN00102